MNPSEGVKKELEECLAAQRRAESVEERISRLRSRAERMTTRLTGLPGVPRQEELSRVLAEIEELEAEYGMKLIDAMREAVRLYELTASLSEQQQEILGLRYADGMKWTEIAKKLTFSRQHCLKLHADALKNLEAGRFAKR